MRALRKEKCVVEVVVKVFEQVKEDVNIVV